MHQLDQDRLRRRARFEGVEVGPIADVDGGRGQFSDELISLPSASNTLTPATSACPLALAFNASCISGVDICALNASGVVSFAELDLGRDFPSEW